MPSAGLNFDGVDTVELFDLLLQHFGTSESLSGKQSVFKRIDGTPCLDINLDKKQNIISIKSCPGLTKTDVNDLNEKIEHELRRIDGIYVHRDFLFYTVPVNRAYRYSDVFQIFPVPPGAPKPDMLVSPHPFVIEVSVPAGSNIHTNMVRGRLKAIRIRLVLAVLLQHRVSGLRNTEYVWVYDESVGAQHVSLKQAMYTCNDLTWRSDVFTDISEFPSEEMADPNTYYHEVGVSVDDVAQFPSFFDNLFQRYFALNERDRQRFERACYWYAHAAEVWQLSRSASYVALVTSIECMLEADPDVPPCETCGKYPTDGPTKKFRSFMETHVPGAGQMSSVKSEFYDIRSRMTHGSRLMSVDFGYWWAPRHVDEDRLHRQLTKLVQIALVNWLATV